MSFEANPFILQARDVDFLFAVFGNQNIYDTLFSDFTQTYHAAVTPNSTTSIRVDSFMISTLVLLSNDLRNLSYLGAKNVYDRIDAAIRSCNNSFLTTQLNALNKKDEEYYDQIQQQGRETLR